MFVNVEIKARCENPAAIRKYLTDNNADYKGTDTQTDTYFNVQHGRLKLRQGNIENNLIYYERSNGAGPKESNFNLIRIDEAEELKAVLTKSVGIKTVVVKQREIYYIGNVKFHIDAVPGLGNFVEIEAGNIIEPAKTKEMLQAQCAFYLKAFNIKEENLLTGSYSDMIE